MPRWCKVLAVPVSAEAWDGDANLAAGTEAGAAMGARVRQAGRCCVWFLLQGAVHIPLLREILNLFVSFHKWAKKGAFAQLGAIFLFFFPCSLLWVYCSSEPLREGIYCHL